MARLLSIVALVLSIQGGLALPIITSWNRYAQKAKGEADAAAEKKAREADVKVDPSMRWFTQRLDHFDRQISATWQQRFFINDTFFDGTGPVFLCVGGEGPAMDASVLVASAHCNDMVELAPHVGALMLALEHRYYGESMPLGRDFSTETLRWLSSTQALGDLAEFHTQVTTNYSLAATNGTANKWVSFGGSYPGMLSGFFRVKYPHLVHAAVSSSSPWLAKLDMQEYQDLVGDSLAIPSVGGSDACKAAVVDGHVAIGGMIGSSEGRESVALAFNFCDPANALPSEQAAGEWAGGGVVVVPSQENDPSCATPGCDLSDICAILAVPVDSDDDNQGLDQNILRLAAVSSAQHGGRCLNGAGLSDYSASPFGAGAAEEEMLFDVSSSARSWPYQTCTEFGFYQTCEVGSRCPFVQGYQTLNASLAMCGRLFGLTGDVASQVQRQVDFSNALFGGASPAATRVMYPNGNVDPWHGLGVLVSPSPSQPVLMVDGASHHFWTHPAAEISQPAVAQAKADIQQQVVAWLAEDDY